MKSVPTAVGSKMEGEGGRSRQKKWDIQRYELWQEHLDGGTESRFKPDKLFESCKAASSATGLQPEESLLWPVPQMQLGNYLFNISKLACLCASKEI